MTQNEENTSVKMEKNIFSYQAAFDALTDTVMEQLHTINSDNLEDLKRRIQLVVSVAFDLIEAADEVKFFADFKAWTQKSFTESAMQTRGSLRDLGDNLRSISKEIENCSYLLLENPNGSKNAPLAVSVLNMFVSDCNELQKKILYVDGALKRVSEEVPKYDAALNFSPIMDEKLNSYITECVSEMSSQTGRLFTLVFNRFWNERFPGTIKIQLPCVLTRAEMNALVDLENHGDGSSWKIMDEFLSVKPYVELSDGKSFKLGKPISYINISSNSGIMTINFTERFIDCVKNHS